MLKVWSLERAHGVAPAATPSVTTAATTDALAGGVPGVVAEVASAWVAADVIAGVDGDGTEEEAMTLLEFLAEEQEANTSHGVAALAIGGDRLAAATEKSVGVCRVDQSGGPVLAPPKQGRRAEAMPRLGGFRHQVTALAATDEHVYAGCASGAIHALRWVEAQLA